MEPTINEAEFALGWNHADILNTHAPEMLQDIDTSNHTTDDYFLGFHHYQQEQERQQTQFRELQSIRNRTQERGQELDLERE